MNLNSISMRQHETLLRYGCFQYFYRNVYSLYIHTKQLETSYKTTLIFIFIVMMLLINLYFFTNCQSSLFVLQISSFKIEVVELLNDRRLYANSIFYWTPYTWFKKIYFIRHFLLKQDLKLKVLEYYFHRQNVWRCHFTKLI